MAQKLLANFRTRIIPNRIVRVRRIFPGKSHIQVQVREEVNPEDIIGKSLSSGGFSVVNLAADLGISAQDGEKYLQKKIGDHLYQGELLAEKKNLLGKKIVTSPTDGILESYDKKTGSLRLNLLNKELLVTSGVHGIVEAINPAQNEVIIKTMGTQVFGILGSGKERGGILQFISGGGLVQKRQIDESMRTHILVAQSLIYGDAIKQAMSLNVSGIISGGIEFDTYESIIKNMDEHKSRGSDVGISMMVSEGFGPIVMGSDILSTLQLYEGKFVFLNGNSSQLLLPSTNVDSILTIRKTALPNLKIPEVSPEITIKEIEVGANARVIWPPFIGAYGKVVAIDQTPSMLSSSINTFLVTLETNKRKIKIPYTNIELV